MISADGIFPQTWSGYFPNSQRLNTRERCLDFTITEYRLEPYSHLKNISQSRIKQSVILVLCQSFVSFYDVIEKVVDGRAVYNFFKHVNLNYTTLVVAKLSAYVTIVARTSTWSKRSSKYIDNAIAMSEVTM
jgi:hypothetical protein